MIISIDKLTELKKTLQNKTVVLAGGCFDLLHEGHVEFLRSSKAVGDVLVVLLESDQSIREHKGDNRPYNTQQKRAEQLIAKTDTDIAITLPYPFLDIDYDSLVTKLKPAIIATTLADPYKYHKDRQASLVGATVLEVIKRLPEHSTTKLLKKNE
jgi:cytidyltransferase-like protein